MRVKSFSVHCVQRNRAEHLRCLVGHSQCELADSHALFRVQVDRLRVLNSPPCCYQHAVDLFTGYVFGSWGHFPVENTDQAMTITARMGLRIVVGCGWVQWAFIRDNSPDNGKGQGQIGWRILCKSWVCLI